MPSSDQWAFIRAKRRVMGLIESQLRMPETPERNLWVAVIEQGIYDAFLRKPGGNTSLDDVLAIDDARRWLVDGRLRATCDMLGLDYQWVFGLVEGVGEVMREHGEEWAEIDHLIDLAMAVERKEQPTSETLPGFDDLPDDDDPCIQKKNAAGRSGSGRCRGLPSFSAWGPDHAQLVLGLGGEK